MSGWTDGVARATFYSVGAYHDGYYSRPRQPYPADFASPEQARTLDQYYNLGVTDQQLRAADRFAGQQGLGDPGANVPIPVAPETPPVYVPPNQAPPPNPDAVVPPALAQYWYDQGYDTLLGAPPRTDLGYGGDYRQAPTGTPAYWYGQGYEDRIAGRPRRQIAAPVPPVDGGAPLLDPNRGYELYPTIFGRGVPVKLALATQALFAPAVKWELLGGYQGDEREGFRLSGPRGPVLAVGRATGRPPASYGLPAYVGVHDTSTRGRSHVRLLDRRWLETNIGPDWWALA